MYKSTYTDPRNTPRDLRHAIMSILDCYDRTSYGGDSCSELYAKINEMKPTLRTFDEKTRIVKVFSLIDSARFNPDKRTKDYNLCVEFEKNILSKFLPLYKTYDLYLYPTGLCRESVDVQTYLKSTEGAVAYYVLTFLTEPDQQQQAAFARYEHQCRWLVRLTPNAEDIVRAFLGAFKTDNDMFLSTYGDKCALYKFLCKFYSYCRDASARVFGAGILGKRKHCDSSAASGPASAGNGNAVATAAVPVQAAGNGVATGNATENPIVIDDE